RAPQCGRGTGGCCPRGEASEAPPKPLQPNAPDVPLAVMERADRRFGHGADLGVAALLAGGAAIAYSLTFHPDWIYDPLRYAELMQRGPVRVLLGPQHALGNLLPLLVFRAARGLGYGGHAMPVLAGFGVAGAATAVGA